MIRKGIIAILLMGTAATLVAWLASYWQPPPAKTPKYEWRTSSGKGVYVYPSFYDGQFRMLVIRTKSNRPAGGTTIGMENCEISYGTAAIGGGMKDDWIGLEVHFLLPGNRSRVFRLTG